MSIIPRVIDKNKNRFVTLHMNVRNGESFPISGKIMFEIFYGGKPVIRIEESIEIMAEHSIDKHYKVETINFAGGRYDVRGSFCVDNSEFLSETKDNDFFDVK